MATAHAAEDGAPATGAAPTLGLVLAGLALVASFLPWTGQPSLVSVPGIDGSALAATLALGATVTFSLRRHGTLNRPLGSTMAGLLSFGVAVVALARLVTPALGEGTTPTLGLGLPIAGVAGLFAAVVAVADFRAITDDLLWTQVRAVAIAIVIGFAGFLVSTVVAYSFAIVPMALVSSFGTSQMYPIVTAGSGIGLGLFTLGYLRYRDLGLDYIDVKRPDLRDVGYSLGGLLVIFLGAGLVSYTFTQLGLPTADSSIQRLAEQVPEPAFLLPLVPLSWLAIGPGEELVYRNVLQKYLYESFSRRTAVFVASVTFAAIHFQQYADPNPIAMLSTLFIVFVLSLVLGYSYYKSENILVPIFIHGTFNAIQFYALYVELTGTMPGL
ncbi:CPBP family intramembrane glutamic endopeptidase [Halorientalis brevis]|uniref:CPBP family intramembrane glutamic endopeptidase n=1 Tax=Halorientalis brevis TaxID=1126241 RepID=A0ABD6C6U5_9EURY|nr:type II CAAX endopeptidase family protein [Halorientalis brevis]